MTITHDETSDSAGAEAAIRVRRFVNDQIAAKASRFAANENRSFEFLCECGNLVCKEVVELTLSEYSVCAPGSVIAAPVPARG